MKQIYCKALSEISEEVGTSRITHIYALSKHNSSVNASYRKQLCFGEHVSLGHEDKQKVQEISQILKQLQKTTQHRD